MIVPHVSLESSENIERSYDTNKIVDESKSSKS